MKQEDLEQLIRVITAEVLKAVSSAEAKGFCNCTGSVETGQGECCQTKENGGFRFQGGVLSVADVEQFATSGSFLVQLGPGTVVTPLAREVAVEKGITLTRSSQKEKYAAVQPGKRVFVVSGREHNGQQQAIASVARAKGYSVQVEDPSADRTDALLKAAVRCAGFMTRDGSGRLVVLSENVYPLAFQLGKNEGVRPAVCWDAQTALQSEKVREANVLVLSNRLLGIPMLRKITESWLVE
jgi:ribose 5-phosphate isomerase RpiB